MKTIDIIERSQTRHALQEERDVKNLQVPNHGAFAPERTHKNGKPISDQKFQQKKSKGNQNHEN